MVEPIIGMVRRGNCGDSRHPTRFVEIILKVCKERGRTTRPRPSAHTPLAAGAWFLGGTHSAQPYIGARFLA